MIPIELPEKYYLEYFESLLAFVEEKYGNLLNASEKRFLEQYRSLPEDARCLFIRLVNRRGCYFRVAKLQYAEIEDLDVSLRLLIEQQFFAVLSSAHLCNPAAWLGVFTKAELLTVVAAASKDLKKQAARLKKEALLELMLAEIPIADLLACVQQQEGIIKVNFEQEIEVFKFLYFGNTQGDMTQFVVRDIGYIKTETLDNGKLQALFKTRQEVEDKLLISKVYQTFKDRRDEQQPAEQLYDWFEVQKLYERDWCLLAQPTFDKLCLRLAKLLEQQRLPKLSLDVYRHTEVAPARERRARLLHKLGMTEEALALCQQINEAPQNAEERYFAEDFCDLISKKRKRKRTTDYLKNSESIVLDDTARSYVEMGVLTYFKEQGYEGVFTENYLWRGFFGLFFWDIIFDQESDALHHPLQTTPSDFYTPNFLKKRRVQFDQRLEALRFPERFLSIVRHHFDTKAGMSNPMVGWHESLLPLVEQCYAKLQPKQLSTILLEMARDLRENTRGFPDLFIWDEHSYAFIEVKSPNDHLSAQQLYWLHFFEKHHIKAQVIRVQWQSQTG